MIYLCGPLCALHSGSLVSLFFANDHSRGWNDFAKQIAGLNQLHTFFGSNDRIWRESNPSFEGVLKLGDITFEDGKKDVAASCSEFP